MRHAVQGWILDPRLNFGLEVEGDVEVGRASLQINSKVNNEYSIYLEKKTSVANKPCLATKFVLLIVYKRLQIFQSE